MTKNVSHCGNTRPGKDWLIGYNDDDDNCNFNDGGDGNVDDADWCIAVKVEIFRKGICAKDNNINLFNNHNNNNYYSYYYDYEINYIFLFFLYHHQVFKYSTLEFKNEFWKTLFVVWELLKYSSWQRNTIIIIMKLLSLLSFGEWEKLQRSNLNILWVFRKKKKQLSFFC